MSITKKILPPKNPVILGSASDRRRDILRKLGLHFKIAVPDVDEVLYGDNPRRTVFENAANKFNWCRKKYPENKIITADTVIDFEGRCVSKPLSLEEAKSLLLKFSDKKQDILTAVALSADDKEPEVHVVLSSVKFKKLNHQEIEEYFSKVDPLDKAGAYNIDQHADIIIDSYSGSYSNIMGLPIEVIKTWLKQQI